MIHYVNYTLNFIVEDGRNLGKMKLKEPGKQKLGRMYSMQSYILTYYRLRKREPLVGVCECVCVWGGPI